MDTIELGWDILLNATPNMITRDMTRIHSKWLPMAFIGYQHGSAAGPRAVTHDFQYNSQISACLGIYMGSHV